MNIDDLTYTQRMRFLTKIKKTAQNKCWEWQASTKRGYGRVMINKKECAAHRIAWIIENGNIPDGMQIRHLCHNKLCCNPKHLLPGTNLQNCYDDILDFGYVSQAKLTPAEVIAIRKEYDYSWGSQTRLAKKYNVTIGNIASIVNNKTWKHLNTIIPD